MPVSTSIYYGPLTFPILVIIIQPFLCFLLVMLVSTSIFYAPLSFPILFITIKPFVCYLLVMLVSTSICHAPQTSTILVIIIKSFLCYLLMIADAGVYKYISCSTDLHNFVYYYNKVISLLSTDDSRCWCLQV